MGSGKEETTSTTKCSYVWLSVHRSSSHSTKWSEGSHRGVVFRANYQTTIASNPGRGLWSEMMSNENGRAIPVSWFSSAQQWTAWTLIKEQLNRVPVFETRAEMRPPMECARTHRVSKSHFFMFLFLIYITLITENCNMKQKNVNKEISSCSYWRCWCSQTRFTTPNNGNVTSLKVVTLVWESLYTSNIYVCINPYIHYFILYWNRANWCSRVLIWEVLGSSHALDIWHPEVFCGLHQSLHIEAEIKSLPGDDTFLQHHFQFTIHQSSYQSTLHSLSNWQRRTINHERILSCKAHYLSEFLRVWTLFIVR
jgi:hypothetical protein